MAHLDRDSYDPLFDDATTFDATEEEEDEGGGRSPLFLILAILVLLAFAGVVWVAYQQGVRQGTGPGGAPPVIAAPQGPTRVQPDNPGGLVVPDQDKLVYERLTGDTEETPEQLMAPPEQPAALPPSSDGVTVTQPLGGAPAESATELATAEAEEELEPPAITITPAPAPDIGMPPPVATTPAPSTAPAAGTDIAEIEPEIAAAQADEVTATSGVAVVQIGAYETDILAAGAWQDVKSRNTDLLARLKPDIKMVTVNGKVWYRLRIGPFETRSAANDLCASLKSRGRDCLVAKP